MPDGVHSNYLFSAGKDTVTFLNYKKKTLSKFKSAEQMAVHT